MAELNLDVSQELNITTRRGDSLSFTLQFKDADGALVPISDIVEDSGTYFYNFVIEVRDAIDNDDFGGTSNENIVLVGGSITYLSTRGITASDPRRLVITTAPSTSKVSFFATSSVMRGIEPGKYYYDIEVQKSTTLEAEPVTAQTWIRGTFTVIDDVTVTG